MGDMQRLHRITYLIQARGCVPIKTFLDELEISKATFKRDLEYLRSRLNASIVFDRFQGGYCFENPEDIQKIELPGLWFTEKEATALALMHHLLSSLDKGGLIGPHIEPLSVIIDNILGQHQTSAKELRKRIKVLPMAQRKTSVQSFAELGSALLNRQRLRITYYAKVKNETTQREISPQQLIYYRDNWYVDAYCHLRDELRSFAVDGIRSAVILDKKAKEVPEKELKDYFGQSYGLFSGKANKRAKLRFTPEQARWVSTEVWHQDQVGYFDREGYYILEFNYNQDPELVMDILKYGSAVEVLAPASLRKKVIEELRDAINGSTFGC
ncbi:MULTISPECIES: WYL domain-containing protein [unclassified Polynucleobacter]|uniref:helix-turn-helix transcriptional regulator n=1 Tax=unclassified Polynucleobacter TaxID=2640945 RepID=UPI0008AC3DFE|nr:MULTISPECIES: WYL domain-containing protein [unclassified Polynucleobacter]MBU3591202.1 WYL domain-containing protein [Polynucleobacter sp. 78F-HAINBA]OHC09974.1 MAG: DNA-binding protein [Polynucleobacter sp. GWA2_45_21]HBK43050.1 transcriptional regulator [Polynucleobacter sp.]